MSHRPVLALVLSAAVLAGCSGMDDGGHEIDMTPYRERVEAEGRVVGGGEGDALEACADPDDAQALDVSAAGAELEVAVPADADDAAVEALEDYRTDSGAGPVCWVVVAVDNSGGDEVVGLPRVEVVAADGRRVRLQRASEALAGWADLRPEDDASAARAVELAAQSGGAVGPGDEGEVVFVADTDLDDPRGVRLQLGDGTALVDASR